MATIDSTQFGTIANEHLAGVIKDIQGGSTVAALSGQEPMKFGTGEIVKFSTPPKAEFVTEGADKSPTPGVFTTVSTVPHKTQVTVRVNEEVKWADEDYQLEAIAELKTAMGIALARALDLGLYYRINPLTGLATAWTNYLNSTTLRVEIATANLDEDIEEAAGLVIGSTGAVMPTGIALAPSGAFTLGTLRDTVNHKLYPDIGFGVGLSRFEGLECSVSSTVAGLPEVSGGTDVVAIVGDFRNGLRWGIQREIPIQMIEYGDPDGIGDLKRANQIALRAEILYAWYVDPTRFAVVEDATS